jgi:hypothetical protein
LWKLPRITQGTLGKCSVNFSSTSLSLKWIRICWKVVNTRCLSCRIHLFLSLGNSSQNFLWEIVKNAKFELGMVACACNFSTWGSWGEKIRKVRLAWVTKWGLSQTRKQTKDKFFILPPDPWNQNSGGRDPQLLCSSELLQVTAKAPYCIKNHRAEVSLTQVWFPRLVSPPRPWNLGKMRISDLFSGWLNKNLSPK